MVRCRCRRRVQPRLDPPNGRELRRAARLDRSAEAREGAQRALQGRQAHTGTSGAGGRDLLCKRAVVEELVRVLCCAVIGRSQMALRAPLR